MDRRLTRAAVSRRSQKQYVVVPVSPVVVIIAVAVISSVVVIIVSVIFAVVVAVVVAIVVFAVELALAVPATGASDAMVVSLAFPVALPSVHGSRRAAVTAGALAKQIPPR